MSRDDEVRAQLHREAAEYLDGVASGESDQRKAQFWQDTAAHVRQEGGQWVTAKQIAVSAGIAESAGRDLVRRLKLDSVGRDPDTGAKLYDAGQAQAALANPALRPGQGARTDLKDKNMTNVDHAVQLLRNAFAVKRSTLRVDQAIPTSALSTLLGDVDGDERWLDNLTLTPPLHELTLADLRQLAAKYADIDPSIERHLGIDTTKEEQ